MWNILAHDLNSTEGDASNNLTIKQYTQSSVAFNSM